MGWVNKDSNIKTYQEGGLLKELKNKFSTQATNLAEINERKVKKKLDVKKGIPKKVSELYPEGHKEKTKTSSRREMGTMKDRFGRSIRELMESK